MKLGFIGVGTVSSAVINAICTRAIARDTIYLSPRSVNVTHTLAARYDNIVRLESNQAVIDASGMVVLSMRPQQMDEAFADLVFREDQIIVSFIAGSPPSEIAQVVSPAHRISQLIPLPAIELHKGPLLICPGIPEVLEMFEGLGDIIVLEDEKQIRVLSCTSAIMSTYYMFQNTLIDWASDNGIDRATSAMYVRSIMGGLTAVAQQTSDDHLANLPPEHETKGGLNERVRAGLTASGWYDSMRAQLDNIYNGPALRPTIPKEKDV